RAKTICSSVNRDFFISTTSAQGSIHHAGILFLNGAGFWVRVSQIELFSHFLYLVSFEKSPILKNKLFHCSRHPSNSSILETVIDSSVYSLKTSTPLGLIVIV
ncbi:hypothetical protein, partial [Serratia marcescens]